MSTENALSKFDSKEQDKLHGFIVVKNIVTTQQINNFLQQHGDFKIYGEPANDYIFHGAQVLNELDYWCWIKTFDPNRGFVMSENNHVMKIGAKLESDGHSGTTFAFTMRLLQKIAKDVVEGDGPNVKCTICQCDEYCGNKTTLECGHMYHVNCIQNWFIVGSGKTCPLCRLDTLPNYES